MSAYLQHAGALSLQEGGGLQGSRRGVGGEGEVGPESGIGPAGLEQPVRRLHPTDCLVALDP